MLFRKGIEPSCSYCRRGSRISEDEVVCVRRGIVAPDGACKKFVYDPLQREPERPVRITPSGEDASDFTL